MAGRQHPPVGREGEGERERGREREREREREQARTDKGRKSGRRKEGRREGRKEERGASGTWARGRKSLQTGPSKYRSLMRRQFDAIFTQIVAKIYFKQPRMSLGC